MFTPKWKNEAKHLYKGSKKFLHYKRDFLEQKQIDEIESRRSDLKAAVKSGNQEATKEAGKQLQATCEHALPSYRSPDSLAENVEVFFVAIVIALGLRAYYLQPFRIPTGSMRPTLNGLIGYEQPKGQWPSLPVRTAQKVTHGRSYFSVTTEEKPDRITDLAEVRVAHFFTKVQITFASGRVERIPGSINAFLETLRMEDISKIAKRDLTDLDVNSRRHLLNLIEFPANFTIAEGYINTGDLILVDKFSYHFRSPKPGEVFVFDTREIKGIQATATANSPAGSHYIKRLIGTPGDTLELRGGDLKSVSYSGDLKVSYIRKNALLYRNGEKMDAAGVLRVESMQDGYGGYLANSLLGPTVTPTGEAGPNSMVTLRNRPSTGLSEYWAMGDNSYNSLDSRSWGTVKEFNLIGPAFVTLWPFGSGHWGLIR